MCVFFFKRKTAYEMRISDWSSDVCSSDLRDLLGAARIAFLVEQLLAGRHRDDPVVETAGLLRRRGALLALQRVRVLLRKRDAVAFGGPLGRLDHRDVRGRLLREHRCGDEAIDRSEEPTSELQSLKRITYHD